MHSVTRRKADCKGVLGVWDVRKAPVSSGGLVLLVEDLQAQVLVHGGYIAGICFIGGPSGLSLDADSGVDISLPVMRLDAVACEASSLLAALLSMEGVNDCYQAGSIVSVREFVSRQREICVWPPLDDIDADGRLDYPYGTTFFIQRFYREYGSIPSLSMKPKPVCWALDFIQNHVSPTLPVVVHLKNNPRERGCSNARFREWAAFFKTCEHRYDAKFILVGNEDIDDIVCKLSNVVVAREYGSSLPYDLALIQTAFIFMGMASGPCNMALFGDTSYLIYKNPDHHAEQMALEFGAADCLPFATQQQKFLRKFETAAGLMSEFAVLFSDANRDRWERRLVDMRCSMAK